MIKTIFSKQSRRVTASAFVLVFVLANVVPQTVFALDVDFFSGNDILFYNPDGCDNSSSNTVSGGSNSTNNAAYEQRLETALRFFTGKGLSLAAAAGIAGNLKNESGIDPAKIQGGAIADSNYQPKNGVGFGIAQWTFTSRQSKLVSFAKNKGKNITDLDVQLEFLWQEATGSAYSSMMTKLNSVKSNATYNTVESPVAAAILFHGRTNKIMSHPIIKKVDPKRGFEGSADSGDRIVNKRGGDAKSIFNKYSGKIADGGGVDGIGVDSGSSTAAAVDCGNTAVSGDIVETALSFALDTPASEGMNQKDDAKPEYIKALETYNIGANWADCGIFVATVMIASGSDVNYPKAGTANQLDYVKRTTDKYQVIESPTRDSLITGDILIVNKGTAHHTMIYTGNTPYPAVDASQDSRVPSVRTEESLNWILRQDGVVAARLIK